MVRAVTIFVVLVGVGVADADETRKVRIETTPPGAVVYLVEKEAGPACQPTPCSVDAPIGKTALIIEMQGFGPVFDTVVVPRRGSVKALKFTLDPAKGTIIVDGPKDASVSVDDEDKGKAPITIEVSGGEAHHVVVTTAKGKKVYDEYLNVDIGAETPIKTQSVVRAGGDGNDGEVPEEGEGGTEGGIEETAPTKRAPRASYIRGSAAFDVGFRKFTYDGATTTSNLREESEGGQVLAGPMLEVWPGALAGVPVLRGLSLMGRFQLGLNQQPVTGAGISDKTSTFWQSFEVSLRQRWWFRDKFSLEIGAGYVRDRFQFSGTPSDIEMLPDVDYASIRIGARGSVKVDRFEPFLSIENRVVIDGGKLGARFDPASSANGLRGAIGVMATFGPLTGRFELSAMRYSWTFTTVDPMFDAKGGTDAIEQLGFGLGYEY